MSDRKKAATYLEEKHVNYARIAEDVLNFWKDEQIFERSVNQREGAPVYTFYEGPPSANGTPGIHHVMARTVKDIFCRYKTLKGFQVKRKGGWDTHGLPVELQVEKELGITKEDIGEKISVEEYNEKCREAVMKYKGEWDTLTQLMGFWVDLDDPYITFNTDYIETLWYLLKELYKKDLLYKGYTIQPYSPKAGTGLSSHELNMPGTYRDVKDTSVTAQFRLANKDNEYLLAWTTTPWTLPSNAALAVGERITYLRVRTFNPYTYKPQIVILAKDRLAAYFNEKDGQLSMDAYKPGDKHIPYEILEELPGKQLVGKRYEQLLPYVQPEGDAFRVIAGDFVSTEDGTGIVHIAPTFGADDMRVAQKADIPAITVTNALGQQMPLVDKQGRFLAEVTDFAGRYVKEEYEDPAQLAPDYKPTDVLIAIKLKEENKAFRVEKYEHAYPHCWRTDKPVLYYPLDSWFIRTTAMRDRLVALNNTINWKPASTGTGRFGNWLENLVDWNLSRSRFWGTPLPIWVTEDRTEQKCIGSIAELREEVERAVEAGLMEERLPEKIDLHRPFVDNIVLVSELGKPMYREPDLIDVWFDSGAMPYAQWHYPFENKEVFTHAFPADFIAEGVDQTRGWFFTLHAIASMLFDSVAFKNVIANGLVLDKNGNKMSKRLGNAVDPFQTLKSYGADATRWYMITNANPWDNLKFNAEGIVESQRRFFSTLQNTYSFFALYANIDGFAYDEETLSGKQRTESDRWIVSRLNTLIKEVTAAYEAYEPTRAGRLIQLFVSDDLSNWYVRLNRKRYWRGEYNEDKVAAYQTLYTCLIEVAKMASPIAPFYMDYLFRNLNQVSGKEEAISVHLADFPEANDSLIDTELEEKMHLAQTASSLVHSLRKQHQIKVRQPLQRIMIPILSKDMKDKLEAVADIIMSEVNVKEISFITDTSGILVKKIKPNFKKLGSQYGPLMKDISRYVKAMDQDQIQELEKSGSVSFESGDQNITLTLDDVEISSEDIPGWSVATEGALTVALDISITDDLRREGLARDFVNRIQNLRKDSGMDVQDRIHIYVEKNGAMVQHALQEFENYIRQETQADQLHLVDQMEEGTDFSIDDYTVKVKISK